MNYRPTWAEISLPAYRQNLILLARLLPAGVRVIAVLKANGYGHGAVPLAKAAVDLSSPREAGAPRFPLWGFGVSSVEEGLALRSAGLTQPILILGSLYPFESFAAALENDLVPTVASRAAAQALSTAASDIKKQVPVHMKVDTGMGRIGMTPEAALETAQTIMNAPALSLEAIYTHLAYADSVEFTRNQLDLFRSTLDPIRRWVPRVLAHAANSAATFQCPQSHYDMVRPGLALYGIHPFPQTMGKAELAPVLSWKTKVVFLKTVQPGTSVSYGATYRTSRPSRLATLPVGYADGYRRLFTNKGWVLVKGRRCPVVGRVTMDQTIVDVTDVPGVDVGEDVVLIGAQGQDRITVEEMAGWADTISYEIVCGIAPRVPRITKETI